MFMATSIHGQMMPCKTFSHLSLERRWGNWGGSCILVIPSNEGFLNLKKWAKFHLHQANMVKSVMAKQVAIESKCHNFPPRKF
jgi:hypothetical protein